MKITAKSVILPGTVVALPGGEVAIIKEVCREPDGLCYKAQFVEEDGDDYVEVGEERVIWQVDLVGGEI